VEFWGSGAKTRYHRADGVDMLFLERCLLSCTITEHKWEESKGYLTLLRLLYKDCEVSLSWSWLRT